MNQKTFLWMCTLLSLVLLLLVSCQKATVGKAIGDVCDANILCDAGEVCVAGYCEAGTDDGDTLANADDQCPDQVGDPLYYGCPVCGNEVVEDGEDCDDGLHCADGTSCTVNDDCNTCVTAGDCLDNTCMPRSGDGCTGAEQANPALHCQAEGTAPDAGTVGDTGTSDMGAQGTGDTGTAADTGAQGVGEVGGCLANEDCSAGEVCLAGVCAVDDDGDSVADDVDNCPGVANPTVYFCYGDPGDPFEQCDEDSDGVGNACDSQICGNGKVEAPEACDLGASNSEDGWCTLSCLEGTLTEEQFKTKVLDTLQRQLTVVGSGQEVDPIREEKAKKKKITELFLVYLRGLS